MHCSYMRRNNGATHVAGCTPFVTEVIGTSFVSLSGHIFCQSARETSPCLRLTPLVERHMRKASGVSPKVSACSPSTRPNLKNSSCDKPSAICGQSPNPFSTSERVKRIMARGDGRVRGKYAALADAIHRFVESDSVFLDQLPGQLQS